ncbi:MAG: hypothetical protein P4L98_25180 [Ancalomicrobiaceae bacterium]|nr:hypothetical protein [Ancalomicrobiaceae bacterium]
MIRPLAALLLGLALLTPAAAEDVRKPGPGSAEEKAIEDVMRAPMEDLFGKPIAFRVQAITVYRDYAYVLLHPERPGGKPIDAAAWKKAVANCEQDRGNFTIEALLKKSGPDWRFDLPASGKPDACASDTIVDEGALKARGLPIDLILSDN